LNATTLSSLKEISAANWDRCTADASYNPFISHAFLSALEDSGSATARTGWKAQHVVHMNDEGEVDGVVPCYLKSHSQGEYVFDYGWAEAFHRAGGHYYPKLQVSVPFTPVTGPRLIASKPAVKAKLLDALVAKCRSTDASSVHMTFVPEPDWTGAKQPWLKRQDIQFHWSNAGYQSFDDFLGGLSSQKRKNIRKERASIHDAGLEIEWITGSDLREQHWDAFFQFYMDTGSRKWGSPYLTREFFSMIGERMPKDVLLILAKRNGRYIAGALNLIGGDALYGRNWGCVEQHANLHFDVCYYQAIDFAIQRKLLRVEAGAQGQHKLARGYLPVKTYSLHYLAHPGLSRAVADYLEQERLGIDESQEILAEHSPFKKGGDAHDL
jgi:uncharacterized protein